MLVVFVASYTFKNVLQFGSALPELATMAFNSRPLIIAYLHLVLIGFVSFALLFFIIRLNFIPSSRMIIINLILFIAAFTISELLLVFHQNIESGALWLLLMATLQLLAILIIWLKTLFWNLKV